MSVTQPNTDSEMSKHQHTEPLPPTPPLTDGSISGDSIDGDDVEVPLPPPSTAPVTVLDVDLKTPDSHVPRDPRLIRLTGVHPFNVEAPLTELFDEGFLTSPELFYVRNHGAVPEVLDEEIPNWEFTVEGLVENPATISLTQLMTEYEQVTCPITLVCAGNRRKEQNMVRKSKGFSWGAAGLSTALFTGVIMSEVIKRAKPKRGAKFVCMEGADQLPNGNYGTSVKLNWVMDPNKGFMLSYKMNGEILRPDHGKPLRVVIPGQIGGRSVKWLKRLIVTAEPSDNWYHIYDNRVLPTMVSPEESANNDQWWKDERYAIYDLSNNSAICYPQHEEQLCLSGESPSHYRAKGYAYSGGGRRITRVEISIDKGKSWRLANIEYAEDRYRETEKQLFGGRIDMSWRESCFCWCFWSLDIATAELADAKDIFVRAMDESMNVQPRDMYWSVLGMMNNPWFRVTISREGDYLRFEHPTQPALQPGGWMERVKKAGGNLANGFWGEKLEGEESSAPAEEQATKEISMTKPDLKNPITIDEFRKHDKEDAPWFVVNGEVYDGTAFLKGHPGGAQSIISAAATDATEEFMAIHSETAKAMMPEYHIGSLDDAARTALTEGEEGAAADADPDRPTFLLPKTWTKAILHTKRTVSWDTRIFTYKLSHPSQRLGLPVGQHLMVRLRDPVTREAVIRSYTPISEISDEGFMEMLVKIYFDSPPPPAPTTLSPTLPTPHTSLGSNSGNTTSSVSVSAGKGGKMSLAMDALPIGHFVEMKGPVGKFEYLGRGQCLISGTPRFVSKFVMICGGSGVTPIYQVFRAVMRDAEDKTKCVVFDGNRMLEDILCKEEIDELVRGNEEKATVLHTLTQAPEGWEGLRGRVTGELVGRYVKREEEGGGALVLVCGPGAMEASIKKALLEVGWGDEQLMFF